MSFITFFRLDGTRRVRPTQTTFADLFERRSPPPPPVPVALQAGLHAHEGATLLLEALLAADPTLAACPEGGITRRGRHMGWRAWSRYVFARVVSVAADGTIAHVPWSTIEKAYFRSAT